ncbi:MAG: serine/threonine-protein kinase [Acidobacteriota bacterium]
MLAAPAAALLPYLALVLTRPRRTQVSLLACLLLLGLHSWWLLPLLGILEAPGGPLALLLALPLATPFMVAGHLVVFLLFLAAMGAFSPPSGSAADLALRAEKRGDLVAAGELWQESGRPRRALRCFSRARAWSRAADVARSLGHFRKAALLAEREGGAGLATAAQLHSRAGDEARSQSLWLRHAAALVEARQPEAAIEPFLRAGDPKRAASAVELALEGQRLPPALTEVSLRATREARRPALGARVALAAERYREAGDLFLAGGEPLEAAHAFTRAGDAMRAAEAFRLAGHVEDAARLRAQSLSSSGQLERALGEYENAGMPAQAAATLAQLGRWDEALQRYVAAGMRREAAEVARDHGDPRIAARLFEELADWGEAGGAWDRAGEAVRAAACHERAGDLARALHLLETAGRIDLEAQLLARLGRVEEGFGTLFASGDRRGAWELLSSYAGTFPNLAEPLATLADWLEQQGELTAAVSAVQRATAGMSTTRQLLPALYTQAHLLESLHDFAAAASLWQRIVDFDYAYRDAAERLKLAAAASRPAPATVSAAAEPAARYVIEGELGRGGMGVVYQARDERLGRTVAIKVLNPRQHTPEALRRFEREARSAAGLSHPGIVHIYDFDRGFGSSYIAMEYVAGPTLNQLLREEAAFVRRNLLILMRQIGEAVAYAHGQRVVHRDLKPANMILAERRQVKILDFGIARRLGEQELTASGASGTPYYMAPEQILGEEPDERTDIYSLGVTFYQMATGALPFSTGNVLRAHLEQAPPDPRPLAPDLDPSLAAVMLRCLAKDPAERFRDGSALLAALPVTVGGLAP